MRKAWFNLLALGAVISAGACAAGTEVQGGASSTTSTTSTQSNTEDSGTTSTMGGQGSDDAGSSQLPPTSEDSGSSQQMPTQDAGTPSSPTVDSGSPVTPQDSGSSPISDDAGAPSNSTTCDATFANGLTWSGVATTVASCATNADCPSGECCYVPTGALLILGAAACITPQ